MKKIVKHPGTRFGLCCLTLLLTGCFGHVDSGPNVVKPRRDIGVQGGEQARQVLLPYADQLASDIDANATDFDAEANLLFVMTFTDVNHFMSTLNFGRTLTDCMISSLQQKGFKVLEVRKSAKIHMDEKNGEYLLSRKTGDIDEMARFHTCLIGTYSIAYDRVIVNARLTRVANGQVISSGSLEIPIDKNIEHLLSNVQKTGAVDENVAVMDQRDPGNHMPVYESW